jgi:hypothetical protein
MLKMRGALHRYNDYETLLLEVSLRLVEYGLALVLLE